MLVKKVLASICTALVESYQINEDSYTEKLNYQYNSMKKVQEFLLLYVVMWLSKDSLAYNTNCFYDHRCRIFSNIRTGWDSGVLSDLKLRQPFSQLLNIYRTHVDMILDCSEQETDFRHSFCALWFLYFMHTDSLTGIALGF